MVTEYMPWYGGADNLARCETCAALVVSMDAEVHSKWHEKLSGRIEGDSTDLPGEAG